MTNEEGQQIIYDLGVLAGEIHNMTVESDVAAKARLELPANAGLWDYLKYFRCYRDETLERVERLIVIVGRLAAIVQLDSDQPATSSVVEGESKDSKCDS